MMAEMMGPISRTGGEVVSGVFCTSGPTTWPNLRHWTGRIVNRGDVVYADMYNASWNGYKTCYYPTFSCGEPSKATGGGDKRGVPAPVPAPGARAGCRTRPLPRPVARRWRRPAGTGCGNGHG